MNTYIISIKTSFLTVEFFIKRVDKYRQVKHGKQEWLIELDNPTRKTLNWYLRNYMNIWSFIH